MNRYRFSSVATTNTCEANCHDCIYSPPAASLDLYDSDSNDVSMFVPRRRPWDRLSHRCPSDRMIAGLRFKNIPTPYDVKSSSQLTVRMKKQKRTFFYSVSSACISARVHEQAARARTHIQHPPFFFPRLEKIGQRLIGVMKY